MLLADGDVCQRGGVCLGDVHGDGGGLFLQPVVVLISAAQRNAGDGNCLAGACIGIGHHTLGVSQVNCHSIAGNHAGQRTAGESNRKVILFIAAVGGSKAGNGNFLRRDGGGDAGGLGLQVVVTRIRAGEAVTCKGDGLVGAHILIRKGGGAGGHGHIIAVHLAVDNSGTGGCGGGAAVILLVIGRKAGDGGIFLIYLDGNICGAIMGDAGIGDRQGCTGGIRLLHPDGRRRSIRTGNDLQNGIIGADPSPLAGITSGLRNTIGGSHGEVRIAIGLFGGSTGDDHACIRPGDVHCNAGGLFLQLVVALISAAQRNAGDGNCLVGTYIGIDHHTLGFSQVNCHSIAGNHAGQRTTGESNLEVILCIVAVGGSNAGNSNFLRRDAILHAGGLGIFTLAQRDAGGILARIGGGIGGIIIGSIPAGVRHRDVVHRNALPIVGSYRRRLGTAVINCIGCGNRHAAADSILQRAAGRRALGGDGRTVRRVAPAVLVQAEEETTVPALADHVALVFRVRGENPGVVQLSSRTGGKLNRLVRRGRCRYGDADAGILRQALIDGDGYIFA